MKTEKEAARIKDVMDGLTVVSGMSGNEIQFTYCNETEMVEVTGDVTMTISVVMDSVQASFRDVIRLLATAFQ